MRESLSSHSPGKSWKELYTAALLENNRNELPQRIAAAEKEIVARAHQLFDSKMDSLEEGEALDDALYMLRALKGCLQFHEPDEPAA
jgi:hypothetical protein